MAIAFSSDCATTNSNLPHFQLVVSDQGPGIPAGELESIFEKFVQSTRTRTGAGGTGLGLAISREIVAAHDGQIWATNGPDGGAQIAVTMPIRNMQTRDRAGSAPENLPKSMPEPPQGSLQQSLAVPRHE